MVKRYLKSGVMENEVVSETKEGSPQGGNLSPLLANVYLNEFDWEFHRRAYRVSAMRTISYCWRKVNGPQNDCWNPVRSTGGDAEAEGESGKESNGQRVRNPKF